MPIRPNPATCAERIAPIKPRQALRLQAAKDAPLGGDDDLLGLSRLADAAMADLLETLIDEARATLTGSTEGARL